MLFHHGGGTSTTTPPTGCDGVTAFTHSIIYYCARYESAPHAVPAARRTDRSVFHLRASHRRKRSASEEKLCACVHIKRTNLSAFAYSYAVQN